MTCLTNTFIHTRTGVSFNVRSRCSILPFHKVRSGFATNAGMVIALSVIIAAVSSHHGLDPVMLP